MDIFICHLCFGLVIYLYVLYMYVLFIYLSLNVWCRLRQQSCLCPHCTKNFCDFPSFHSCPRLVSQSNSILFFSISTLFSFCCEMSDLLHHVCNFSSVKTLNFLKMSACFFFFSTLFIVPRIHFTHPVLCASFVFLSVCVCSTKSKRRPHSHRTGR